MTTPNELTDDRAAGEAETQIATPVEKRRVCYVVHNAAGKILRSGICDKDVVYLQCDYAEINLDHGDQEQLAVLVVDEYVRDPDKFRVDPIDGLVPVSAV